MTGRRVVSSIYQSFGVTGSKNKKIPENSPKFMQNRKNCIFLHFRKVRMARIQITPLRILEPDWEKSFKLYLSKY